MKRFILYYFIAFTLLSCGNPQGQFRLTGEFEHLQQGEFYLYCPEQGQISFDTIKLTNGKFEYQRELQEEVIKDGKLVKPLPTVQEEQQYCASQMETLYPEVRRLENPHKYYVDLTEKLLQLKKELIGEHKAKVTEGPVLCKKK